MDSCKPLVTAHFNRKNTRASDPVPHQNEESVGMKRGSNSLPPRSKRGNYDSPGKKPGGSGSGSGSGQP